MLLITGIGTGAIVIVDFPTARSLAVTPGKMATAVIVVVVVIG